MRISSEENDAGFYAWATAFEDGWVFDVLLDGQRIDDVVTADEEQGFLIRDVPTASVRGDPMRENLIGSVKLIAKRKPWEVGDFHKDIAAQLALETANGT